MRRERSTFLGLSSARVEGVAAHVPAQGGDLQAQVADVGLQVPARLGVQRLGAISPETA